MSTKKWIPEIGEIFYMIVLTRKGPNYLTGHRYPCDDDSFFKQHWIVRTMPEVRAARKTLRRIAKEEGFNFSENCKRIIRIKTGPGYLDVDKTKYPFKKATISAKEEI